MDEFGLHLNSANRKYGSSSQGVKIRKPGNYDRGMFEVSIILAVETGDLAIPAGVIGAVSNPRVDAEETWSNKASWSQLHWKNPSFSS